MRWSRRTLALSAVLVLAPLRAQNIHIEATTGHVAVLRGDDATGPLQRDLHATLVTGDRIVCSENAEAQVSIDGANTLQIAGSSEVSLAEIYPGRYQMILEKGAMTWRVRAASAADSEIVTPSVAVRPRQPGAYSIVLNDRGETEIVPQEGSVEVFAATGSQWVNAGQKMLARGPADNPEFQIVAAVSRWKRFLRVMASLQIGVDLANSVADMAGGAGQKPRAGGVSSAHNGSAKVQTPETGHAPANGGHSIPAAPAAAHK